MDTPKQEGLGRTSRAKHALALPRPDRRCQGMLYPLLGAVNGRRMRG